MIETRISEKLPPHDLDAEEAVIGSLLIDGPAFTRINLKPEHFYYAQNSELYSACQELYKRGESIDQITVAQELQRQGKLENCGGAANLSRLISICPTSMDIDSYANIVMRLFISRRLIAAADRITAIGYQANPDSAQALDQADSVLLEVRKLGALPAQIITPLARADMLLERYSKLNDEGGVAVPTGIIDLDRNIGGGLYAGEMAIIAARPGMGKTTLLMNIAKNGCAKGKKILVVSIEMPHEAIGDREIAAAIGLTINDIRCGSYSDDVYRSIVKSVAQLSEEQIYFYEGKTVTTADVMSAALEMKLRYGLDLIVIDYLGLLQDDFGKNSYERLGFISRKVKQIARTLDVPILAAHQLSRGVEGRDDRRPVLSDLRDSGRLEEDADLVMFHYRDDYYRPLPEPKPDFIENEIIIAKQRQGDRNFGVKVLYDRKHQQYKDKARADQGR